MGPGGATVPSRFFPVPSRLFPVPRRSLPVLSGYSRFIPKVLNILILPGGAPVFAGSSRSSPMEPRFIPVEPRFIPVDPGSRTGAPPAS
ncbi:hypothetical protein DPMN_000162 [Dreissena polymorpha]|uniref:Uncharacterized protein n=1 Tax=Dreissena polymorpha TaxID=45954 RepID=A0A9D4MGU5_DREPO|nr:hypothetical protein DPMN_000162 [Dreissena polymorpha]